MYRSKTPTQATHQNQGSILEKKSPSFFRNSSCRRGHSLMRRTQFSWEKLRKKQNIQISNAQKQPNLQNNDYLMNKRGRQVQTPIAREKNKGTDNLGERIKFQRQLPLSKQKNDKRTKIDFKTIKSPRRHRSPPLPKSAKRFYSDKQINNYFLSETKTNERPIQQRNTSAQKTQIQANFKRVKNHSKGRLKKIQNQIQNQENLPPKRNSDADYCVKEIGKPILCQPFEISKEKQQSTLETMKTSNLPIFSRKTSTIISKNETISDKILLHLEIIKQLAEYSKNLIDLYEETHDWEELIFLVYKKYYLQRVKVARSLRGIAPSPFVLNICNITTDQLCGFRKKFQGIKLVKEIQSENRTVLQSMRNLYNLIIQKSGKHINMEEKDNFSGEIFKNMNTELQLLREIRDRDAKKRMNRVYRCAFLIAELQGNKIIGYEQSLDMDDFGFYLQKASSLFYECFNE